MDASQSDQNVPVRATLSPAGGRLPISMSHPLPPRARRLAPEQLSRVFGGCQGSIRLLRRPLGVLFYELWSTSGSTSGHPLPISLSGTRYLAARGETSSRCAVGQAVIVQEATG
jgi:hypothetical protein